MTWDLSAGAGKVDMTPAMGTQIAGDIGRPRPAEFVVEPIHARAAIFEGAGRRVCVVSLETCAVTQEWSDEIRRRVSEVFGFDRGAVLVHAVQNHAAPSLGHHMLSSACHLAPPGLNWLQGGDDRYHPVAVERALEAVARAAAAMQPVRMGVAAGVEGRVAFNRRFVLRDGSAVGHPKAADMARLLHVEGPIDPEIAALVFANEALEVPVALLSFTCHPVHGYPRKHISHGWPGEWARRVEAMCRGGATALVLNGFCGNIHHRNHQDPYQVDDYLRMGEMLAQNTADLLKRLDFGGQGGVDWRSRVLRVPQRTLTDEQVRSARETLERNPEPPRRKDAPDSLDWDWVYALALLDLKRRQDESPDYPVEVQAFRVGQAAIVGAPGEPFVEGQLGIKRRSPTRWTYPVHMCNDSAGYIPTRAALAAGGYETRVANWSHLAPQALEMIEDAAVEMLGEMFG